MIKNLDFRQVTLHIYISTLLSAQGSRIRDGDGLFCIESGLDEEFGLATTYFTCLHLYTGGLVRDPDSGIERPYFCAES